MTPATQRKRLPTLPLLAGAVLAAGLLGAIGWRVFRTRAAAIPTAGRRNDRLATTLTPRPMKVSDGVYFLGDMAPSAVYVIDTAEGLAMIDSGLAEQHQTLLDGMTSLGLDIKRLKLILITHAHGDHSMGAERLRREFGAKVYIGQQDAPALREGGPNVAIFSKFDMPDSEIHPTTIDGELVDGEVFDLGDARITAIATPGHTPGSFCYLLERDDRRLLFTGDTVMTLAELGTYPAYLPPAYRGNAETYLASLKKLRAMPAPDLVLPGHPRSERRLHNPRVAPGRWREMLDHGIEELTLLIKRRARDGANFLDGTPREIAENLFYLGDLDEHAVYALKTPGGAFLFDAACGQRPMDFMQSAWKMLGVAPPPVAALLLTSCRARNLQGLRSLTEATHCRVVASSAGLAAAKRECDDESRVSSSEEPATVGFEGLEALSLAGRGDTAVGYHFTVGDKLVLVTGDLPIEGETAIASRLLQELSQERWEVDRFAESLEALAKLKPDIWLSARPLFGRSANLYDDDWSRTISLNRRLLRQYRSGE